HECNRHWWGSFTTEVAAAGFDPSLGVGGLLPLDLAGKTPPIRPMSSREQPAEAARTLISREKPPKSASRGGLRFIIAPPDIPHVIRTRRSHSRLTFQVAFQPKASITAASARSRPGAERTAVVRITCPKRWPLV